MVFEVLILWRIAALGEEQLGQEEEEQMEPLCGTDILKGRVGAGPRPSGGGVGVGVGWVWVCAQTCAAPPVFVHIVRRTAHPRHSMLRNDDEYRDSKWVAALLCHILKPGPVTKLNLQAQNRV